MKKTVNCFMLAGVMCLGGALVAAEQSPPADKPEKASSVQQAPGNMPMRGRRDFMRRAEFGVARMVRQELKTYLNDKTDANFAALEKAVNEAIKADTVQRKARLEQELANLEKVQTQRASRFLDSVKSGEFKMPERPRRAPGEFRSRRGGAPSPAPFESNK